MRHPDTKFNTSIGRTEHSIGLWLLTSQKRAKFMNSNISGAK